MLKAFPVHMKGEMPTPPTNHLFQVSEINLEHFNKAILVMLHYSLQSCFSYAKEHAYIFRLQ